MNVRDLQDAAIHFLKLNVLNRVTSVPVIVENVVDIFLHYTLEEQLKPLLFSQTRNYLKSFSGPTEFQEEILTDAITRTVQAFSSYNMFMGSHQQVEIQKLKEEIYVASSQLLLALRLYEVKLTKTRDNDDYFPDYVNENHQDREKCRELRIEFEYIVWIFSDSELVDFIFEEVIDELVEAMLFIQENGASLKHCVDEYSHLLTSMASWQLSLDFQKRSYAKDLVEETEINILLQDRAIIDEIIQRILAGNMSKIGLADEMSSTAILEINAHLEELMSRVSNIILQPLRSYIQDSELAVTDAYTTAMEHAVNLSKHFDDAKHTNRKTMETLLRRLALWRKPKLYLHNLNVSKVRIISKLAK